MADIVKAAKASPLNEVTLLNALTAAGIENVDEDSLAAYATAIVDADVETLEDVQVAIDEANEELAEDSAAEAKVKAIASATNQVQLLKALQDNFVRVNADWNGGYATAEVNTAAAGAPAVNVDLLDLNENNISNVTAKDIQAAVDAVNASNVSDAWDTAWESAKSEDLAKAKALGTAYIADDTDADKAIKAYLADEVARLEAVIKVNSATTNNSFKNALEALDKLENELVEKYKTTTYASKFQNDLDLKTVNADLYAKYIAELAAITVGDDKNQTSDIQGAINSANVKAADQQIITVLNADATKISAALTALNIKQVATTTEHATQYNTDIDGADFSAIFTTTGTPVTAITYEAGKTSADAITALKGLVDAANIKVIKAEKSDATKLVTALNVLELKNVKPENAAAYLANNNLPSGDAEETFQGAVTTANLQSVVNFVNAQVLEEAALEELNAATTAAEVSAALIDLNSTDFINVLEADKLTVAAAVLAARDELATKKFDNVNTYSTAVSTAVGERTVALGNANKLNSASTITDAQAVLEDVAPTTYAALSNQAKVDAGQALLDSLVFADTATIDTDGDDEADAKALKTSFKTLKAVLTAAGL
ncbi:hypothetical protein [Solibacillus silvestris]|uniref:hypothetical protein n=1 Tax=Solibacillus silvestris TaxID=76853 RepID=UPI0003009459|nr:hypothetical protein [Solibacillus silvestris]